MVKVSARAVALAFILFLLFLYLGAVWLGLALVNGWLLDNARWGITFMGVDLRVLLLGTGVYLATPYLIMVLDDEIKLRQGRRFWEDVDCIPVGTVYRVVPLVSGYYLLRRFRAIPDIAMGILNWIKWILVILVTQVIAWYAVEAILWWDQLLTPMTPAGLTLRVWTYHILGAFIALLLALYSKLAWAD